MEDEDYIGYSMEMHCMTPDQKLLYLKELVDSMQKDYKKPGFIVTSVEELEQKLDEGLKSSEEERKENALIATWTDKNLENYDVQTQLHIRNVIVKLHIMKIRLKLEHQLGNFYKMGLKEHDFFIKPIQEKIDKLPKFEDEKSSY